MEQQLGALMLLVVAGGDALVMPAADLRARALHFRNRVRETSPAPRVDDRLPVALEDAALEVMHSGSEQELRRRQPEPEPRTFAARPRPVPEPEIEVVLVRALVSREARVARDAEN